MNIYNFKVDFEESKILDEDFESLMDRVIIHKTLFNIGVMDVNGNGFVELNKMINLFIEDCLKEREERCFGNIYRDENFGKILKDFVEHCILYYWNQSKLDEYCYKFDVFYKGLSCIVYIPKTLIDKELYTEYLLLGSDFLLGAKGITDNVLFQCVLPAFYFNLVKEDLTTHEEYTKLQNYHIGLH